jgi:hypothetical protein
LEATIWAATTFAVVVAGVICFQVALALGAPWGSYAMGGAFPGRFPPRMRVAALVQAALLAGTLTIVLARANLVLQTWSAAAGWLIWGVVAVALVAVILNFMTPSAGERRIWVPVALVMLLCSLVVALAAG